MRWLLEWDGIANGSRFEFAFGVPESDTTHVALTRWRTQNIAMAPIE